MKNIIPTPKSRFLRVTEPTGGRTKILTQILEVLE